MNNSNYTSPSNEPSNSKQYTVVIGEGKRKCILLTNSAEKIKEKKQRISF